MAFVSLSIKYRPVRIGFLVRDSYIDDLVKSAGINTLLWGGIYNPIIPVSDNQKFAEQLLNLFSVDVLFPISSTKEIDELMSKYPLLKDPGHYAENIFYKDWYSKKNILGYLSSLNIVDNYWEKEFKNKSKDYKSNYALIRWENSDDLKNLFSVMFGYFPIEYNLKYDFQNAFLKGLCSKEIQLSTDTHIPKYLAKSITPIKLTRSLLKRYGGSWTRSGIYIGDGNNFYDLLYFWNLRASGLLMEFLPKNQIERFKEFIKASIEILDNIPNRNPHIEDYINIYYRSQYDEIKEIIKKYQGKKHFVFSCCDEIIWNDFNIEPADFYLGLERILASVDKSYNRYVVSIELPEKKFIINKDIDMNREQLAVSIDPIVEYGYPEHTLKPPYIRQLNEVYSREIVFDPWKLRVEKDGIAAIIKVIDNLLYLHPIPNQKLIQKIFELAGIKSEVSQAGLITKRIIEKLGGVDGGRVFKIRGVRKLLQTLKTDECISRGEGTNTVWEDGEFKKHEKLFIEARETPILTTHNVFDFMLKKDFLRPGLELICDHCKLYNWISLEELDDTWTCNYCGDGNKTSLQLKDRGDWRFRKSGLFAKDNNQEGAIPVILTLLVFLRIFDYSNFIYSPSLNLETGNTACEIDFCVLHYQWGDKIQLGIGECKNERGIIDQKDVDNLKMIREKINNLNIDCYLVFSKVAEKYEESEINLFKKLKAENIPVILLTNKELEPYYPYWEIKEVNNIPEKYAHDMAGMARNSEYLYLKD